MHDDVAEAGVADAVSRRSGGARAAVRKLILELPHRAAAAACKSGLTAVVRQRRLANLVVAVAPDKALVQHVGHSVVRDDLERSRDWRCDLTEGDVVDEERGLCPCNVALDLDSVECIGVEGRLRQIDDHLTVRSRSDRAAGDECIDIGARVEIDGVLHQEHAQLLATRAAAVNPEAEDGVGRGAEVGVRPLPGEHDRAEVVSHKPDRFRTGPRLMVLLKSAEPPLTYEPSVNEFCTASS